MREKKRWTLFKFLKNRRIRQLMSMTVCCAFFVPGINFAFDKTHYVVSQNPLNSIFNPPPDIAAVKFRSRQQPFKRVVIHIQDLHCHYSIQKNISRILDHLVKDNRVSLIGMEGVYRGINMSRITSFPLAAAREEVSDYLMQEGRISGAEYYLANGYPGAQVVGIEDEKLYEESRQLLQRFLSEETMGYCIDIREQLDSLKPLIYNRRLQGLDQLKEGFLNETLSLTRYGEQLIQIAGAVPLAREEIAPAETMIEKEKPDRLKWSNRLEVLESAIRRHLYESEEEKALDKQLHALSVIEKLFNIAAGEEDLKRLLADGENYNIESIAAFIRQYKKNFTAPPAWFKLNSYLDDVKRFYQLAHWRSDAFVSHMLAQMDKHQVDIAVMITGGFHTERVLRELKKHQCGYISVEPAAEEETHGNPYIGLLQNNKMPLEKLLQMTTSAMALRTPLPDTAETGRIIPVSEMLRPEEKLFARFSETLLEIAGLNQLALSTEDWTQLETSFKQMMDEFKGNESGVGIATGDMLLAPDHTYLVVNTGVSAGENHGVSTVIVFDKQQLNKINRADRLQQIDLKSATLLLVADDQLKEVLDKFGYRQSSSQVVFNDFISKINAFLSAKARNRPYAARLNIVKQPVGPVAWITKVWQRLGKKLHVSTTALSLIVMAEELVFSGLFITVLGPLLAGVTGLNPVLGLGIGVVISMAAFFSTHARKVLVSINGKLLKKDTEIKDLAVLGSMSMVIRLGYAMVVMMLPFGVINVAIALPLAVILHDMFNRFISPRFAWPMGITALAQRWLEPMPDDMNTALLTSPDLSRSSRQEEIMKIEAFKRDVLAERLMPGSVDLIKVVAVSDQHGSIKTFDKLILDAIRSVMGRQYPLPQSLDPVKRLRDQGIDLNRLKGKLYFQNLGDLFDKTPHGIKVYNRMLELKQAGLAESIMGNHDIYALISLMGFHLPFYKGFQLYGYHDDYGDVDTLLKEKHRTQAETQQPGWWANRLDAYIKAHDRVQAEAWQDGIDRIMAKYFDKNDPDWLEFSQAAEHVGYMSIHRWQALLERFKASNEKAAVKKIRKLESKEHKGKEAGKKILKASEGKKKYRAVIELIEQQILPARKAMMQHQVDRGRWWWRVFDAINDGFQETPEWKGIEWLYRANYGGLVLKEWNEIRPEKEKALGHAGMVTHYNFTDMRDQFRKTFNLFLRDMYQHHYMHAVLPADKETLEFYFSYKGRTYRGNGQSGFPPVWQGLRVIEDDIRNPRNTNADLHEAMTLLCNWYFAKTTETKARHVAPMINDQKKLEQLAAANGFERLFIGHLPFQKLAKLSEHDRGQIDEFQTGGRFVAVDHAMPEGAGAAVHINENGIALKGFEPDDGQLKKGPRTMVKNVVLENKGIGREPFLNNLEISLERRLNKLKSSSVKKPLMRFLRMTDLLSGENASLGDRQRKQPLLAAAGGTWPWMAKLLNKTLHVPTSFYQRYLAWFIENTFALTAGGVLIGLPAVLVTGNINLAAMMAYAIAWPILFGLHFINGKPSGASIEDARWISGVSLAALGLALVAVPMSIIVPISYLVHLIMNLRKSKIEEENKAPVLQDEKRRDYFRRRYRADFKNSA